MRELVNINWRQTSNLFFFSLSKSNKIAIRDRERQCSQIKWVNKTFWSERARPCTSRHVHTENNFSNDTNNICWVYQGFWQEELGVRYTEQNQIFSFHNESWQTVIKKALDLQTAEMKSKKVWMENFPCFKKKKKSHCVLSFQYLGYFFRPQIGCSNSVWGRSLMFFLTAVCVILVFREHFIF